jgi:hypothetical protein
LFTGFDVLLFFAGVLANVRISGGKPPANIPAGFRFRADERGMKEKE